MRNLFILSVLISFLVACEKESNTPSNPTNSNNSTDTTSNNNALISTIDCAGIQTGITVIKGVAITNLTIEVKYSGGNGKAYLSQSISSTQVTGLKANLSAGTLANGNGSLKYIISGTPTMVGNAYFTLSIGGKTCSFNITVEDKIQEGVGKLGVNIQDIDGNSYKTVILGTQQWMAENLKVSKFNDGTLIPNITDPLQWYDLTTPSWCYYNDDISYNADLGKLYNLYSIKIELNGNKNVCPTGWHVPSAGDWDVLTEYLGGESGIGIKLKEKGTQHWMYMDNSITNSSLFSARAAGDRANRINAFLGLKESASWWSTTEEDYSPGWYKRYRLSSYNNNSELGGVPKDVALSVRCIKN